MGLNQNMISPDGHSRCWRTWLGSGGLQNLSEPKVEVKGITRKGHNTHTHLYTPWKINMEPTNHPFRKGNDLPNLRDYGPCSSSRVYTANATHLFTRSQICPDASFDKCRND